jgi:endonuclease G
MMKPTRIIRALYAFVFVGALAGAALAATVTPSDRVAEFVSVRKTASGSAAAVGRLDVGEEAELLSSVTGWHKVRLADGTVGFVPKGWTHVSAAEPGGPSAPGAPPRPPDQARGDLYAGLPKAVRADANYEVLINRAYTVGYSETRKDPLWVAYRLFSMPGAAHPKKRPGWHTDNRTTARVDTKCYVGATIDGRMIDRGHNAPNFGIATRYGPDAQRETFLMSNVTPQFACLNEQPWQGFEKAEADYANQFGTIWTVTGPIFDSSPQTLTKCGAEVPTAYYKIIVDAQPAKPPAMLAVVMRQTDRGAARHLNEFVTTVDDVEAQTGLDFFSELLDSTENAAEAAQPDSRWQLDRKLVPDHPCRDTGP